MFSNKPSWISANLGSLVTNLMSSCSLEISPKPYLNYNKIERCGVYTVHYVVIVILCYRYHDVCSFLVCFVWYYTVWMWIITVNTVWIANLRKIYRRLFNLKQLFRTHSHLQRLIRTAEPQKEGVLWEATIIRPPIVWISKNIRLDAGNIRTSAAWRCCGKESQV